MYFRLNEVKHFNKETMKIGGISEKLTNFSFWKKCKLTANLCLDISFNCWLSISHETGVNAICKTGLTMQLFPFISKLGEIQLDK